ncbi:MAG: glycosyltransferase [Bacteroidales bacterium]|nr:glycosyltransferase [Bacteroidales bacterium]
MKILILISSLEGGGAERIASRVASALAERNEVHIMPFSFASSPYPISDKVHIDNAGLFDLRKKSLLPFRFLISVIFGYFYLSFIRLRFRPDVTLSFLIKPSLLNAFALGGGRKVMSERNNPRKKGERHFCMACLAYRHADKVIFQSDTVRNMFPEEIRRKGVVIPNPVEVSCKASGDSHKIVASGRLRPQKNFALLIKAFSYFLESHPDHTLHIYGKGPLEEELRRLVSELSLDGKVFIEGYVDRIHEAIRDAEMFVLSSDFEGMPNALLEAMMMGLPCVTTAFEGAEELFGDSESCLMVPAGDEMALAGAMSKLDEEPLFRESLARRAREFSNRFSMEKVIPLWEKEL